MQERPQKWRKASFTQGANNCVELAYEGAVRDSKNPAGGVLAADLRQLMAAVKTDQISR